MRSTSKIPPKFGQTARKVVGKVLDLVDAFDFHHVTLLFVGVEKEWPHPIRAFAGGEARSAAEKSINYKAKAPAVFAAGALKSARKPWKIKALRPR